MCARPGDLDNRAYAASYFGGEKRSTSFAIEAAYWNIHEFQHSFDFGIEFDRNRTRIYSEVQTGVGVTGLSLGPVVQFGSGGTKAGVQGSCWVNYILGADYRIRYISGDDTFHCVGLYAKVPFQPLGSMKKIQDGVIGKIRMMIK